VALAAPIGSNFACHEFHQAKLPTAILKQFVASTLSKGLPIHGTEVHFELFHSSLPYLDLIGNYYGNIIHVAVIGIHHVQLAMPAGGEDSARRFYSGLLKIPEVQKPAELQKRGGAWFETGSLRVHLGVEANFLPAKKAHPGLLVDNLEALVSCLRDAGFNVVSGEPLPGYEHVYVDDPFGNRLELLEALPP
jgi:catechol 2,3-dioxygenase-like lactoylglutathione lyase family enzyme